MSLWKVDTERYAKVEKAEELETLIEEDFQALMKAFPPEDVIYGDSWERSGRYFLIFDIIFACQLALSRSPLYKGINPPVEEEETSRPFLLDPRNPVGLFQFLWRKHWAHYLRACEDAEDALEMPERKRIKKFRRKSDLRLLGERSSRRTRPPA